MPRKTRQRRVHKQAQETLPIPAVDSKPTFRWPFRRKPDPPSSLNVTRSWRFPWVWVVASSLAILSGAGIVIAWYILIPKEAFIGVLGIGIVSAGIYLGWAKAIKAMLHPENDVVIVQDKRKKLEHPANVVNIKVKQAGPLWQPDAIEFTWEESPTGAMREITNLKRFFWFNYVYQNEDGTVETKPVALPDNQSGLTPKELIIPVDRYSFRSWLGAFRDYSLQKLATGALIVIIALEVVTLLAINK